MAEKKTFRVTVSFDLETEFNEGGVDFGCGEMLDGVSAYQGASETEAREIFELHKTLAAAIQRAHLREEQYAPTTTPLAAGHR